MRSSKGTSLASGAASAAGSGSAAGGSSSSSSSGTTTTNSTNTPSGGQSHKPHPPHTQQSTPTSSKSISSASSAAGAPGAGSHSKSGASGSGKSASGSGNISSVGVGGVVSSGAAHKQSRQQGSASTDYHSPALATPTSRRIWIKRTGGTPTTLSITRNDIIDDLKLAVVRKFNNTLGRLFDSADLIIKMDLSTRSSSNANTSNLKKGGASSAGSGGGRQSPDPMGGSGARSSSSVLPSPILSHSAAAPPPSNKAAPASNFSLINLEPDQNVWSLLDHYYPNGMGMSEAFVVDAPESLDAMYRHYNPYDYTFHHHPYELSQQQQHQQQHVYQQQPAAGDNGLAATHDHASAYAKPRSFAAEGHHPGAAPGAQSSSPGNNTPLYYQPKPQNYYMNNSLANSSPGVSAAGPHMGGSNSIDPTKDRSLSPSSILGNPSPMHRRAHSNPPQSPLHSSSAGASFSAGGSGRASDAPSASNQKNQNQAILLLPKNFSLTSGNSSANLSSLDGSGAQYSDRKRLSFDEGYMRRHRNSLSNKSGTNLTSIGMGITSPTSSSISYLPIPENDSSTDSAGDFGAAAHSGGSSSKDSDGISLSNKILSSTSTLDVGKDGTAATSTAGAAAAGAPSRSKSKSPQPPASLAKKPSSQEKPAKDKPSAGGTAVVAEKSAASKQAPQQEKKNGAGSLRERSGAAGAGGAGAGPYRALSMKQSKSTTERVLPSISVLVVEDNAINQAILGAFLRKHKIHYQIAKNGQEAIDKWRKGGFHLVLMDIQLPVKSGIEATKEIRHLEKINRIGVFAENELKHSHFSKNSELKEDEHLDLDVFRSPVIIVALTASSNSSTDKKKALMAGCNDYLTKPVNLVWLQNKITEWGCMQALIDFDGWDRKRFQTDNASSAASKGAAGSSSSTIKGEGGASTTNSKANGAHDIKSPKVGTPRSENGGFILGGTANNVPQITTN